MDDLKGTTLMTRLIHALALTAVAALAAPAIAEEEQAQHYAAKSSETLGEAVANFAEYNKKVAAVLEKEELTVSDMEQIHQLTYTLEEALARINKRMKALPVTLEELHLASEAHNPDRVRGVGGVYLETAQTVIP